MQYIWKCPRGQPDMIYDIPTPGVIAEFKMTQESQIPSPSHDFFQKSSCSRSISTPFLTTTTYARKPILHKNVYTLQNSQRYQCTPCQGQRHYPHRQGGKRCRCRPQSAFFSFIIILEGISLITIFERFGSMESLMPYGTTSCLLMHRLTLHCNMFSTLRLPRSTRFPQRDVV